MLVKVWVKGYTAIGAKMGRGDFNGRARRIVSDI